MDSNLPRAPEQQAVYIVDDDASLRDSLSLMLSLHGWRPSTFASAEDFLKVAQADWQGCVIADIRMPGLSGLELQQRLATQCPRLAVIVITAHGDVASARQAFLAQAVDFLEKPFDAEQVRRALQAAQARPRSTAKKTEPPTEPSVLLGEALTPDEIEVLRWVTRGTHNREIAMRLGLSARAVETHKARAMEKLGARSLVELAKLAESVIPAGGKG
ncbi:MAG TPA: response regulator [Ramlibacter sp.]|uniref:response regulator transcription factor n=1 Tax=Ramlibacter sp. TaxID=1917967 RepID=UPI002B89741E|nr:response regulator [Ramlibacter sp.]HVZ44454.1 response regulator [Ramlibacter sp.]